MGGFMRVRRSLSGNSDGIELIVRSLSAARALDVEDVRGA
jgi:hypothetical protein